MGEEADKILRDLEDVDCFAEDGTTDAGLMVHRWLSAPQFDRIRQIHGKHDIEDIEYFAQIVSKSLLTPQMSCHMFYQYSQRI